MKLDHVKHATALNHFETAIKIGQQWTCTCADCAELRVWQTAARKKKEQRDRKRHHHRDLLIGIMSCRARNPGTPLMLAELQKEFEKVMIRKLKLQHLDTAAWYGYRQK